MTRLDDCEKQLIEAHEWGQKMRERVAVLEALCEVMRFSVRVDGEWPDKQFMREYHAIVRSARPGGIPKENTPDEVYEPLARAALDGQAERD